MDNEQEQSEESINWEEKASEYETGWKRALADLDNYRKDMEKRSVEMIQFLKANSLMKFLEIYDDLNQALKFVEEEKAKEGLGEVQKKFKNLLHSEGLEEVEFKSGDTFDPNLAEAVSYEEHEVGEGKVIETVEMGLKYNDKIIKPAKVRVAK